jgi:hypothetical protein
MRLLNSQSLGQIQVIRNIPPYAILSHTWGEDELTFRDMVDGTSQSRAVPAKIKFCAQQAAMDGFEYFWVDTCCINKSDHTELSEAINSMFRWYQNASRCYVYLDDVSTSDFHPKHQLPQSAWEPAFRASRWFTRGWTLQELLAPSSVHFYSREGTRLGDKVSLANQIHEITGIPEVAIRGITPLSFFSVAERMSWASNRQTTIPEDEVYSILGLFDCFIPLIYGEGREHALIRLRESIEASLNSKFSETNKMPLLLLPTGSF